MKEKIVILRDALEKGMSLSSPLQNHYLELGQSNSDVRACAIGAIYIGLKVTSEDDADDVIHNLISQRGYVTDEDIDSAFEGAIGQEAYNNTTFAEVGIQPIPGSDADEIIMSAIITANDNEYMTDNNDCRQVVLDWMNEVIDEAE